MAFSQSDGFGTIGFLELELKIARPVYTILAKTWSILITFTSSFYFDIALCLRVSLESLKPRRRQWRGYALNLSEMKKFAEEPE